MISGDKDGGQIVGDVHESKYAAVKVSHVMISIMYHRSINNVIERMCMYNIMCNSIDNNNVKFKLLIEISLSTRLFLRRS